MFFSPTSGFYSPFEELDFLPGKHLQM